MRTPFHVFRGEYARLSRSNVRLPQLLQRDPNQRLGVPESGRGDIRDHAFFEGINWAQVEKMQLKPSFKPFIVSARESSGCVHIRPAMERQAGGISRAEVIVI